MTPMNNPLWFPLRDSQQEKSPGVDSTSIFASFNEVKRVPSGDAHAMCAVLDGTFHLDFQTTSFASCLANIHVGASFLSIPLCVGLIKGQRENQHVLVQIRENGEPTILLTVCFPAEWDHSGFIPSSVTTSRIPP